MADHARQCTCGCNLTRQAHKAAYNARYRQSHARRDVRHPGPRIKVNAQTYARHERWLQDDDPPEVIERRIEEELAKIKARRKAQAA